MSPGVFTGNEAGCHDCDASSKRSTRAASPDGVTKTVRREPSSRSEATEARFRTTRTGAGTHWCRSLPIQSWIASTSIPAKDGSCARG